MKISWTDPVKYLIILFSAVSAVLFFWQSIQHIHYPNGNDLQSYVNASQLFLNGENPYTGTVRRYIYPLFMAVVIYPLTLFKTGYIQKSVMAGLWSILGYFAFFSTIFASWNLVYEKRQAWDWVRKNLFQLALIFLLLYTFLQVDFINGQVNLIVVGLTAGFFFMLQKDKSFPAALFLAAAASIKIAPGLCIVLALLTRRYRVVLYFIGLFILFVFILPYLINSWSFEYYRYFINEVAPIITGSDMQNGFENFSLISTISYLFGIHWHPVTKIVAVCLLAAGLTAPVILLARKVYNEADGFYRLACLAAVMAALPLTFPMSESHHLLVLLIPVLVIIAYWQEILKSGAGLLKDRLSLWFIVCLTVLHAGQGLKPTPLRLLALLGIYSGLLVLLKTRFRLTVKNN